MFNSREIAIGIWSVVFLGFMLLQPKIRSALLNVLRKAARFKILVPFTCLAFYTAAVILVLSMIGVWDTSLTKDSVIWFALTGVVAAGNAVMSHAHDRVLATLLKDSLKVIVIFEFVINTYTFPLGVELFLIPILTIVAGMDVVARSDSKYRDVSKLISWIQALAGFGILAFALNRALADYASLFTLEAIRNLFFGPIMIALHLPFMYLLMLYVNYELVFVRLKMGGSKDQSFQRYAKRRLFGYAKLRIGRVWALSEHPAGLMRLRCRDDVDRFIRSLKGLPPSNKRIQRADHGRVHGTRCGSAAADAQGR